MAFNIPTYDIYVEPNYYSADDGAAAHYRLAWTKTYSTTTGQNPNGESRLMLAPWATLTGPKSNTWYIAFDFYINPAWSSSTQGAWGTGPIDCHNTSYDTESIGWTWGPNTSAFQIDYVNDNLYIHSEPANFTNSRLLIKSALSKGAWHSLLLELTFGRTDLTSYRGFTVPQGRVRAWLDGNDTPIDTGPINSIYSGVNPSTNNFVLQSAMMLWAGFYTRSSTTELNIRVTAPRVGTSLSECLNDSNITLLRTVVADIWDPSSGPNTLGPSRVAVLTSRTSADFNLPPSLGGSVPPVTPTQYGQWSTAVQVNAAAVTGVPVIESTVFHNTGEWSTATQVNATVTPAPPTGTLPGTHPAHGVRRTLTFTAKR